MDAHQAGGMTLLPSSFLYYDLPVLKLINQSINCWSPLSPQACENPKKLLLKCVMKTIYGKLHLKFLNSQPPQKKNLTRSAEILRILKLVIWREVVFTCLLYIKSSPNIWPNQPESSLSPITLTVINLGLKHRSQKWQEYTKYKTKHHTMHDLLYNT